MGNGSLQLSATAKETDLLPHSDGSTIVWTDANEPTSPLLVLLIFPKRFHTGAKDVDAGVLPDLVPRHVVEDAVEGPYIGDIVDEGVQQILAAVIWLGMPHRPKILEWKRPELCEDQLVERG